MKHVWACTNINCFYFTLEVISSNKSSLHQNRSSRIPIRNRLFGYTILFAWLILTAQIFNKWNSWSHKSYHINSYAYSKEESKDVRLISSTCPTHSIWCLSSHHQNHIRYCHKYIKRIHTTAIICLKSGW